MFSTPGLRDPEQVRAIQRVLDLLQLVGGPGGVGELDGKARPACIAPFAALGGCTLVGRFAAIGFLLPPTSTGPGGDRTFFALER